MILQISNEAHSAMNAIMIMIIASKGREEKRL
jgi:hypothetical protein